MSFRLALIQPITHHPPEDERNVERALQYIESAAAQGAQVVTFPETYPGPWRMPATFDPEPAINDAAKTHRVYVQYGTIEPLNVETRTAHNLLVLAGPQGRTIGRYRRTHPPGPWIYEGGTHWDFHYVPGDEFPTFTTPHGTFGLAMCSEVYIPEVTRALTFNGAEILFMPAGTDKGRLWDTWRTMIWARAIENLAVVVTTQNLFDTGERGLAMVATPEAIVFESALPGLFVVDIDLERVRQLRSERDEVDSQSRNATKAGLLTQWQRPELYSKIHAEARPLVAPPESIKSRTLV